MKFEDAKPGDIVEAPRRTEPEGKAIYIKVTPRPFELDVLRSNAIRVANGEHVIDHIPCRTEVTVIGHLPLPRLPRVQEVASVGNILGE